MNIVITGGTGFIGTALAKKLCNHHSIVLIDNFSTSKPHFTHKNVSVIKSNIGIDNNEAVIDAITKADMVFHFASSIGVKYICENPASTLHNSMGINNFLFPLFEKYNSKVIYASTSEVYGESESTGSKESDVLKIGSPETARWGYACSKLMAEFLIKSYSFDNIIVRFFNVTGPEQLPDYGMVIPKFFKALKENKDIEIFGDGNQVRSFCHIDDAVNMLEILMDFEEHKNNIYNIGNSDNIISIKKLAEKCLKYGSLETNIVYRNFDEVFGKSFGEIFYRFPDTTKLDKFYKATKNLDYILKDFNENFRAS